MTILKESDLKFQFDDSWRIKKYDATKYYLAISGSGMSAVDFVGLWKNEIVFIEVKNYRNRPVNELERNRNKIVGKKPPLASIFEEKVQESIIGISVIRKFLLRKWIYKQLDKLLIYPRLLPYLLDSEQLFWMYLDRRIKANPNKIYSVLWLELPDELESIRTSITERTIAQFSSNFDSIEVANVVTNPFGDSLEVSTS